MQACPITHHDRIKRHNEIVKKIEQHCKLKKWTVENKPKIRHPDGQLYKPELAIHISDYKGLEEAAEDYSSRAWIKKIPPGWSGRDYVQAVT